MLLPLSKSFNSLKKRLQCISIATGSAATLIEENELEYAKFFGATYELKDEISIENCLRIFDEKQEKVNQYML
jgi:hypothetical protein